MKGNATNVRSAVLLVLACALTACSDGESAGADPENPAVDSEAGAVGGQDGEGSGGASVAGPGDQGLGAVPGTLATLCEKVGETEFETADALHVLTGPPESLRRCDAGELWALKEDPRLVADSATFYFDTDGGFLDICQELFWRQGCERYGGAVCEESDYCE